MIRDEFLSLPASIALRALFDCLDEETVKAIGNAEKPVEPKPPRYDQMLFRREGVSYASECSLSELRYWFKKSNEPGDSKWADANKKRAEALARFIAWREWYPEAVWSGERNREPVIAAAPSAKPKVYERSGRRAPAPPPDDDYQAPTDDGEIPF